VQGIKHWLLVIGISCLPSIGQGSKQLGLLALRFSLPGKGQGSKHWLLLAGMLCLPSTGQGLKHFGLVAGIVGFHWHGSTVGGGGTTTGGGTTGASGLPTCTILPQLNIM